MKSACDTSYEKLHTYAVSHNFFGGVFPEFGFKSHILQQAPPDHIYIINFPPAFQFQSRQFR